MNQTRSYKFLLLEDDESDVFLMKRQLERHLESVELMVASTQEDYERLVRAGMPDVILSDYRLPRYSGIEALLFARAHRPLVPFIFVTGALHNEELAADTILQGASGFVLKNNLDKLWKLLPTILDREDLSANAPAESEAAVRTPAAAESTARGQADRVSADEQQEGIDSAQIAAKLSQADPETLAKIQRLLAGNP